MTRLLIGVSALAGVLLAGSAQAQAQKIAPSRTYGGPVDLAPKEYTAPPRSSLDKSFGLPTFGRPEANMPQQRTLATPKAAPDDRTPDFLVPNTAPNAVVAPFEAPDRPDSMPDVFARETGANDPLPSELNRRPAGSATMDTPLFTTANATDLSLKATQPTPPKPDPLATTTGGSTLDPTPPPAPAGRDRRANNR
jgi:hypothetical protein